MCNNHRQDTQPRSVRAAQGTALDAPAEAEVAYSLADAYRYCEATTAGVSQ
jgi:hypothetical protein